MSWLPRLRVGAEDYAIVDMEEQHTAAAAKIHEQDFANAWTDGDIAQLLHKPGVTGFVARRAGRPNAAAEAFVLLRIAADEAEILTIAVAPSLRRRGIGRALMDSVIRFLHSERIESLFLEVSENNSAAITLYKRLGFKQVAARPDYYVAKAGGRENAIVMRCDID